MTQPPRTTTTAVTSTQNPSVFGQQVTFTATVSTLPAGGTPTGAVSFNIDGVTVCGNVQLVSGQAACAVSTLGAGNHVVSVDYGGNVNFLSSTGILIGGQTVNKATSVTGITSSLNPSVYGQPVTFTTTVASVQPVGTPTGTVSLNIDGNLVCGSLTLVSAQASCTVSPLTAGNHVIVAQYGGDANFNPSSNGLPGGQTVNKATTATTISNAAALSSQSSPIGQSYVVNWTVTGLGSGNPTGNMMVSDGTGATCTASVVAGTCNLTSTTIGIKTITVTYLGDTNFIGSSNTVSHTVAIVISGNIQQYVAGGPNTPLGGVTVTLTGTNGIATTTDASGNYTLLGLFSGNYTVTPSLTGKVFDPINRTLTNVTTNVTNTNFVAYNNPGGIPRDLKVANVYVSPGQPAVLPIVLKSLGNETTVSFSLTYDTNPLTGPTVTCGSSAPGCTVVTDTSQFGKLGITITPATAFTAGQREVAKVTFQTLANSLSNTPIAIGDLPTLRVIKDTANDPLSSTYTDGFIVFAQNLEGDVATRKTGDGQLLPNDVVMVRQFVVGTLIPDPAFNEYQRADSAPGSTKGDGQLDAGDIVQARRYAASLDAPQTAGGPSVPVQLASPARFVGDTLAGKSMEYAVGRTMRVVSTSASAGGKAVVSIELDSHGDESATSFSLNFDPMKLGNPQVSIGSELPDGIILTTNIDRSGQIAVLLESVDGFAANSATKQLITVTFDVAAGAASGKTSVSFGNDPTPASISDALGESLTANYQNGTVTISGTAASGFEIAGRVLTPDGHGLRNAQVSITDSQGVTRNVTTSSFGFYNFENVAGGETYVVSVLSKRFRFASRILQISENLVDVDFVGLE